MKNLWDKSTALKYPLLGGEHVIVETSMVRGLGAPDEKKYELAHAQYVVSDKSVRLAFPGRSVIFDNPSKEVRIVSIERPFRAWLSTLPSSPLIERLLSDRKFPVGSCGWHEVNDYLIYNCAGMSTTEKLEIRGFWQKYIRSLSSAGS